MAEHGRIQNDEIKRIKNLAELVYRKCVLMLLECLGATRVFFLFLPYKSARHSSSMHVRLAYALSLGQMLR